MLPRRILFAAIAAALLGASGVSSALVVPERSVFGPERAAEPNEASSVKKLNAGYEALNRKSLDAAEAAFVEASRLDPKSVAPLLGLAEVARLRNRPPDVDKWLKRALAVGPENGDAQRAWGRYQFALRNFTAAETALQKAASLQPANAVAYLDLGEFYMGGLVRPEQAAQAYRRAIELKPDHAGAHNGLGTALAAMGKVDEAIAEFENAAARAPDNPLPLVALGQLYAKQGNHTRALDAYDRALKVQPKLVPAIIARGDIFLAVNHDPVLAIAEFERAVKLAPKNAAAQFKLGSAYHARGKLDDAERHYRAAIDADRDFAAAYNNLADIWAFRKKNLDGALKAAKRAVELDPRNAAFHDTLGAVYLARGELDPAIAAFRRATAAEPPDAEFFYRLGLALDRKGEKEDAVAAFKRAIAVDPGFSYSADARNKIAELGGR